MSGETFGRSNICSICFLPYHGYGNNAEPVNNGRCCDNCNSTVVIPARLNRIRVEKDRRN